MNQFSVNVLHSPFGVRGANFFPPPPDVTALVSGVSTVIDAQVAESYAQVQPRHTTPGASARRSYAVGGTRGIQQLVANTRSASLPSSSPLMAVQLADNHNGYPAATTTPPLQVISKHERGRLLVWSGQTGSVVAACLFHPSFTVHHCILTAEHIYTTLEGSAATAGAEEETCVYVWSRTTFSGVTVVRGHEGRLTALAVQPMETATLVITGSLDGTVRLWRHQHSAAAPESHGSAEDPVQLLWVLTTAEVGNVQALAFLAADTVVVAGTRTALAFVRFPDAPARRKSYGGSGGGGGGGRGAGSADALPFQTVQSIVDPDGGTTFLHVCPYNRTSGGAVAAAAAAATTFVASGAFGTSSPASPSSPLASGAGSAIVAAAPAPSSNTVYLLTGSTSGYMQEWVVDVDGAAPAATSAAAAYVGIRCRWYHKAHCATVDCVVTDEDVVVSTSMFDGARLYHRKSGATCGITNTAAVPVLVPQLKELVWGAIDGTVSVASYARFASGVEKELQLLWTARPHATAVRGVCLSLTADLRWDALCTGAADGSVCVWRAAASTAPVSRAALANREAAALLMSCVWHILVLPASAVPTTGAKRSVAMVAGQRAAGGGRQSTILVAELTAAGELRPAAAVPLKEGDEVACAHLCREATGVLSLWVGTRGGQLLHATKGPPQKAWTALTPVHWDAKPKGSVAAIADGAAESSTIVVAVAEAADAARASQRLFVAVLRLDPKSTAAKAMASLWEGAVVLPSTVTATARRERTYTMGWLPATGLDDGPSQTLIGGLLVCGSDGSVVRCTSASRPGAAATAVSWHTPELLVMASSAGQPCAIQHNVDERPTPFATAVTAESGTSDLVCVDVIANRKRVLVPAKVRAAQLTALLCDVGSEKVRLAAVRKATGSLPSDVALFDDAGRECGRVSYDGAVTTTTGAAPSTLTTKESVSYTPKLQKGSQQRPSLVAATSADCTAIAAHGAERVVFLGYGDGLLQMMDTTDMYVFCRRWATDGSGTAQPIVEVRCAGAGVVLVRLANHHICTFTIPPRSLLDQASPLLPPPPVNMKEVR